MKCNTAGKRLHVTRCVSRCRGRCTCGHANMSCSRLQSCLCDLVALNHCAPASDACNTLHSTTTNCTPVCRLVRLQWERTCIFWHDGNSLIIKTDSYSQQCIFPNGLCLSLDPVSCAAACLRVVCSMLPVKLAALARVKVKRQDAAILRDAIHYLVIGAQTDCCHRHLTAKRTTRW